MVALKQFVAGCVVAAVLLAAWNCGIAAGETSDNPSATSTNRRGLRIPVSAGSSLSSQLSSGGQVQVTDFQEPEAMPATPAGPAPAASNGSSCGSACGNSCEVCSQCQQCDCCCDGFWQHRSGIFAEYLYLKSYGPDFVHATQQNAAQAGPGTVPFGTAQNLIQPWRSGFRVGGGYALSDCSSIIGTYTQFSSATADTLGLPAGTAFGSVVSSVLVPGSINAGTTFSQISAVSGVNFKTADAMYSRLLTGGENHYVNYEIGARYAHLQQGFFQDAEFAQPNNPQLTSANINFDGGGLRTGLDGRRRIGCGGLSAYGKGFFSLMLGEANAHYNQVNALTTAILGTNNFESARVLPILEYEVGLSWTSCNGRWRFGGGYYTAFWFNTLTNPQYIQAVQNNNFVKLGETMTFTGLTAHAEVRF